MNSSIPDIDPALYPLRNGGPPPAGALSNFETARELQFLDAYHEMNRCVQRLRAVRACSASAAEERAALQAIERALLARDGLEDQYASIGFIATPHFQNGLVKDVRFSQPPRPEPASSLSMMFAVPPPANF